MTDVPPQIRDIVSRLRRNERANRRPLQTLEAESVQSSPGSDEPSDDFLEPEADDGPPIEDEDRPVVSRPSDTAVATAFGWPVNLEDDEVLERLLALNLKRQLSPTGSSAPLATA